MTPPPPATLSGNHPELVVRPRMNSRSEQYPLYHVRAPLTLCLPCVVFVLLLCCVFIVSSPLFYCPVVPTIDVDAPVIGYFVDDRTPYYRASRQAEPLPLSHISPTCLYLSIALGICCCYVTFLFKCIASHCRHLLYLSYIQCNLLYI